MAKRAIITGITGQDGSYLAELLLRKRYEVHGVLRDDRPANLANIVHLADRIRLHRTNLANSQSIRSLIERVEPDEIYSLAAMSFVPRSWEHPIESSEVTGQSVLRFLEAIRQVAPQIRFYQAGSSEVFGRSSDHPQNESTPFAPANPYAVAKSFAHFCIENYRQAYNLFACSGILFNHESPRRPENFVTRKITRAAARIKLGVQKELKLGNLDTKRDWGFAGDYVESMWLQLQQPEAEDFVIGTGTTTRVGDFVTMAFAELGLDASEYVRIDPRFFRPVDPKLMVADPRKAKEHLGWEPKTSLQELVSMMVHHDLAITSREQSSSKTPSSKTPSSKTPLAA